MCSEAPILGAFGIIYCMNSTADSRFESEFNRISAKIPSTVVSAIRKQNLRIRHSRACVSFEFGPRQRAFTQLLSICLPCSVMTDSGWNWTPSTANCLWRTPMISPSSVCAVTSRHVGSVSGLMTSEW